MRVHLSPLTLLTHYRTKFRGFLGEAHTATQGFPSSPWDEDNGILAMPTGMRQAVIGVRPGFSCGVLASSYRRRTLLPDRSKLCSSHWSNQWHASKTELRQA